MEVKEGERRGREAGGGRNGRVESQRGQGGQREERRAYEKPEQQPGAMQGKALGALMPWTASKGSAEAVGAARCLVVKWTLRSPLYLQERLSVAEIVQIGNEGADLLTPPPLKAGGGGGRNKPI